MTIVVTGALHRVRRGHGRGFADEPAPVRLPVRRPARVAVMLALAHTVHREIRAGELRDQAEAAQRLSLTRARMTQLLALLRLAPDLQERVLFLEAVDGIEPLTERDLRPITLLESWADQRAMMPTC
jgi:hypothetical protein